MVTPRKTGTGTGRGEICLPSSRLVVAVNPSDGSAGDDEGGRGKGGGGGGGDEGSKGRVPGAGPRGSPRKKSGCRAVPVPALVTWSRYHAVTWKATHSTPQMVMTRRQPHSRSVETATQVNPSGALVTVYRKAYCTRGRRGRGRRSGGRKGGGGRGRCDWVRSCDRCRWCWW